MPKPQISARYPSPGEIQEVIDDLKIVQAGGSVYVVVDPYEIVAYCFPIDPDSLRDYDIRSVADHQTAFYEVFYGARNARALLLDEYAEEVEKYVAYVKANLPEMYSKVEMLDAFIARADLAEASGQQSELLDELEQNFGVILAVVMGIFSLGSQRLFEVAGRLVRLENLNEVQDLGRDEKGAMETLLTEYRESPLAAGIFEKLNSATEQKPVDSFAQQRKRKADWRDARAVDRLTQLNTACERAYRRGILKNRHLFLYISSAHKSRTIFSLDAVKRALPLINGKKFSFLRNSGQLFCYAVQKSADSNSQKGVEQTIENLTLLQELLEEVNKLEGSFSADRQSECKRCILEGGQVDSCRWLGICSRVRDLEKTIQERQSQIDNLGLISSVQKYQELMKAKAGSKGQKNLLQLFKQVCGNGKIADRALDRMRLLQRLTVSQSELTKMLPKGTEDAPQKGELENPAKIAGGPHQMPTQTNIESPQYQKIVRSMLDAYAAADLAPAARQKSLDDAYEEYLALEATMRGADAEHELVRCLVFLSFFSEEADKKAFEHAVTQLTPPLFAPFRAEFYYLTSCAARRLHYFGQNEQFMREAATRYPDDPRFPFALAANGFSWLTAEGATDECPYTLDGIIQLTLKAVELYERDPLRYKPFIGGNCNNVAYFSAYDRGSDSFDLARSHRYLDKLLAILPREEWSASPEYFHTEAFLLFRDFEEMDPETTPVVRRKEVLQKAWDAVSEADSLRHDPAYGDLKRKIRHAMRSVKSSLSQASGRVAND